MRYNTLITVDQFHALQQEHRPLMVFDCSYDLSDPAAGRRQFSQAHIPGARHADLHDDLSSYRPGHSASGGRHPLPLPEDFAATLRQWGFDNSMQAVVYDRNGCNYCGRLWWMLKWLGHDAVAILDGGLQAWQSAGHAVQILAGNQQNASAPSHFVLQPALVELVSTETVAGSLSEQNMLLLDARGAPRYRGDIEPLDPAAGHIPGAVNRPFADNLQTDGRFKSATVLRQELTNILPEKSPGKVVVYCGSGVSAIPTLLALEIAGYPRPALYAGSWSAWSSTPGLPVERS